MTADVPQPWDAVTGGAGGGAEFVELADTLRGLQDTFTGSTPPTADARRAIALLREADALLATHTVPVRSHWAGRRGDDPARAQTFIPPQHWDELTHDSIRVRTTFGRFHLGAGGAVHGGAHPAVFDSVLGRAAGHLVGTRVRTARLTVNYRAVTPPDVELVVTARVASVEGRKVVVTGELRRDDEVLADAEGLFVTLLPGQP